MRWWNNCRNYFYRKKLASSASGAVPARKICNFSGARHVGVLYNHTSIVELEAIDKLVEELKLNGKAVQVLAYLKDEKKITPPQQYTYFTSADTDWRQVPHGEKVQNFVEKKFDLLLCLFVDENQPLEYIAALSKAFCRVGLYNEQKTFFYDLMVQQANKDLKNFIQQTINFLKQVRL